MAKIKVEIPAHAAFDGLEIPAICGIYRCSPARHCSTRSVNVVNTYFRPVRPNILILEDDMLLAMDIEDHLTEQGYAVAGPFGRISQALEAVPHLTLAGAIVDLNLHGDLSFPVIDLLRKRQVPVIVCSGYGDLPEWKAKLEGTPLLAKPWNAEKLQSLMAETFPVPKLCTSL